jgi:hypothetical protein
MVLRSPCPAMGWERGILGRSARFDRLAKSGERHDHHADALRASMRVRRTNGSGNDDGRAAQTAPPTLSLDAKRAPPPAGPGAGTAAGAGTALPTAGDYERAIDAGSTFVSRVMVTLASGLAVAAPR